MRHRLPSLNALRAFEAAGRHGRLSDAAQELSVTAGAVSRQISLLEAHFGCRLFTRHRRGLELTEKGSRYLAAIADAFERIDAASIHLHGGERSRIAARVFTTFATEWLIPRLSRFRERHPWIDLGLTASLQPVDFDRDEVDVSVLLGPENRPNLRQDPMFHAMFFPVCSPALLERGPPLNTPEDLRHHTLLYSQIQLPNWRAWLEHAGVGGLDPQRGIGFENSTLTYHAAREGIGVGMGQRLFLTEDLISGRLVAPFDLALRSRRAYCLVCQRQHGEEPQFVAFRHWLLEEIGAAEARAAAMLPDLAPNVVTVG